MEDTNQGPQAPADPSSSLERRPSADEDSAAMTIEFLRARLLSERSVSKAARQRAQQLSKKISELEERLEAEIQFRKKLEADRLEILSKYRSELSEEYGEFFASSFGEGLSRNESHAPNEEDEGLSSSRAEHLDRSDSSQRLNHEEANDEGEETDQSGREKGVLSWGRRKGLRREFGHGTDWLGRSLSQRSLASTDGESPQKKWAGKSVRQIRKRESSNLEGEPGQSQVSEDFDGKSGQPDEVKERLHCEDERDTEVERVLERQAELIEQFEAEENAQRAWEAKFKEAKALASHETGNIQSNSSSNLETMTENIQFGNLAKDGAIETESSVSEEATRFSRKVHPEDFSNNSEEIQGGLLQSEILMSEHTSGIENGKNKSVKKEAFSSTNQSKLGPNERLTEMDLPDEDVRLHAGESSCSVLKEGLSSQEQVLSNTDTEQKVAHSNAPAMELGKSSKYKKHLSSSFRFTVFADAEPVTSSSPHMPGFAVYKQETDKVEEEEVGKEEVLLNESTPQMSGFGLSEPHHDEPPYHIAATALLDGHLSVDHPLVSEDRTFPTKDTESREKSKVISHEATHQQENLATENGVMNHLSNHEGGNDQYSDPNREEKRTSGLGGGQDLGRHSSDFPSYPEIRGPGVGLQPGLGRQYSDFPSRHVMESDGANFGNLASVLGNRSIVPGPVLNANVYEDPAFRSQRRSVDGGFDRVADVLRALQIAKYQIESSSEEPTPYATDMPYSNGYDGRDVYYAEPPSLPSVYATPPQYTSPVPYSSRGVAPFSQNMQGWGYGAGSSRQLANAPSMHYASRALEPQSLWPPPPSQGVHNSNLYHYDTRQHR